MLGARLLCSSWNSRVVLLQAQGVRVGSPGCKSGECRTDVGLMFGRSMKHRVPRELMKKQFR